MKAKSKKPKKLTYQQRIALKESMDTLINVFQLAEAENALEERLDELFQGLKHAITIPFCDWRIVENALNDLLDGKLTQKEAAHKIVMETIGLSFLQRI